MTFRLLQRIKFAPFLISIKPFSTSIARSMSRINRSFKLTETESKIRQLLNDYTSFYNTSASPEKQLELRITGGWVRDKLLGDESNDLDIAINHLSGEEFASKLNEFILSNPQYGIAPKSVHKIEKNPEKSKHLETCTTKLYGLDIDFVNLRSETYTSESRIPVINYGTPQEDALRRDATLNALFYNIQKDEVEDLTERGLEDLRAGILRTPLEPLQTFLDDPLRVLRLIRFASRFNFTIEKNTLDAMRNEELKNTLIHKISRERIGVEVGKTLLGPNPQYGLFLVNFTGMFESVFNFGPLTDTIHQLNQKEVPKLKELIHSSSQNLNIAVHLFDQYSQFIKKELIDSGLIANHEKIFGSDAKKHFWLIIVLAKYNNLTLLSNAKKATLRPPAVDTIIKEGLKYGKADSDVVTRVVTKLDAISSISQKIVGSEVKRSEIGTLLRELNGNWFLAFSAGCFIEFLSQVSSMIPNISFHPYMSDQSDILSYSQISEIARPYVTRYNAVLEQIESQNLAEVHMLKPLIDGKQLSKTLGIKPGPWMSKVNERILLWQMDNVNADADDCVDFVRGIIDDYLK